MKLIISIIGAMLLFQSSVYSFSIKNVVLESKDNLVGVVKNMGSFLPSPSIFFSSAKNYIAGYPLGYVSSTINSVCSTLVSSNSVQTRVMPELEKMNFQLITPCAKYSIPILSSKDLYKIKAFDPTKKVVILVTGWRTTIGSSKTIDELSKAYNCRGDVNFIAIDVASCVDTLFTWSALNTEKLGEYLGQGLADLAQVIPRENIHLIGYSLGAHICGSAGRSFTAITEEKIARITGLDPALPCFNEGEDLTGLMRGDADFVDIIHTNPGVLGRRDPIGDVDFYPDGIIPLPTGCYTILCAHERAWRYYVESVYPGNENNFMAKRCNSMVKLKQNRCGKTPAAPMGYAAKSNLRGNYFLEVRGSSPFGMDGNKTRENENVFCGTASINKC